MVNLKLSRPLLFLLLLLCSSSAFSAAPTLDQRNQMFNEALGGAFTVIFEQASGIPASGIASMSGQLAGGDYAGGVLSAAKLATDTALGMIPVIGQAKFILQLEAAMIKVGKTYLDNYMLDIAWEKFKRLSTIDQSDFLRGNYVAEMEASLGSYYTNRNVSDIRELFKVYQEHENRAKSTMENAAKIVSDLNKAMHFLAPELYSPADGVTIQYSPEKTITWWAYGANFFKVTIAVEGEAYSQLVKVDPYDVTPEIKLSSFGADWEQLFKDNNQQPLDVSWQIQSARFDSTGVLEAIYGSDVVVGQNKLIVVPGYDPVKNNEIASFKLEPPIPALEVSISSPANGFTTSSNQVVVEANIRSADGSPLPAISKVGLVVNGKVQYANLEGDKFSSTAVLNTGSNTIKAGAVTADNQVFLSSAIEVNSEALNNTYHIRISWDKNDTDVDLHFNWSGGQECDYSNPQPIWGGDRNTSPALDVDNTEGYGPENITIAALPGSGSYRIWVHYFDDHDNGGTNVSATITKDGQGIFSSSRHMVDGASWTLLEFNIP